MRRKPGSTRSHPSGAVAWLLACALALVGTPGLDAQQGGAIRGSVTDARSGQPVAGAIVEVEGTRLVAVADQGGQYRIAGVPVGNRTVVSRRLGYAQARQSVQVTAGGEVRVDFALDIDVIQLDQVVATGTAGGARVRTIGSSVARVDAASAQEVARAPDMTSLLGARVPGVRINQISGRVGASPTINVRGRSSLGLSSAPLVYIDGVRADNSTGLGAFGGSLGAQGASVRGRLNDIHPDDIESIEVIKGPAAATIYGTEASNGVIQIITKRGAAGQAPQFTLRAQYGSMFFRDAENRVPTNYFRTPQGEVLTWNAVTQERERGTPLFRRGQSSELHGSLSGGSSSFRYYASGSYRDEEGVEPNNYGRFYALHSNVDVEITSDLTFSTSVNFAQVDNHLGTETGVSAMLGATCGHDQVFRASRGFCLGFPPEVPWELYDNTDKTQRFTASGTLAHRPTDWLSQRLTFGMDNVFSDARALERFATPELAVYLAPTAAAGRIGQTIRDRKAFTVDYSGTVDVAVTGSVNSQSSLGLQVDRVDFRTSTLGGMGFPAPGIELISATATRLDSSQSELVNTTLGAYLQQKFGWNDRLFMTAALRVDNNSAFGEDLKWVTYPKLDASWMISESDFWPWKDRVPTLRLRSAYGESGRAPQAFSALRTFSPVQGPGGTNAVTAGSLGNPDLKPERGKEWEVGFEAALGTRLSLDFTYFSKRTEDLIVNQSVAPSTGFSGTVPRNLGQVDNRGFELSASFQALTGDRLAWEIDGNLAFNEDEIVELGQVSGAVTAPGTANRVGYPIGGFWARRVVSASLNAAGQPVDILCDGGPGGAPVACAQAPFVYLGPALPPTSGSLGNTLSIGSSLKLYALMDFASGHRRLNTDEQLRCMGLAGASVCEVNIFPERFDPIRVAQSSGAALTQGRTAYYYQDASFVKLREVSLSYTLPEGWIPRTSRSSLTLSGRELAMWTRFGGLDPENTAQAVLPALTRFTATLNIGF